MQSLFSLLFPPFCVHCSEALDAPFRLLCHACQELLVLLPVQGRCSICFREDCQSCQEKAPSIDYFASCFEYIGPAKSLVSAFKYGDSPYLTKSLASFLFLQFDALDWPLPDI